MKISATKMNLSAGVVLLALAAFFSITLITQPLELLTGTGQLNALWYLGNMLYTVYGLSSILIPVFFLIAGLSCFASNWTARRSMRLLTAVVPFFTAVITENICRSFLAYPSEYNGLKLAVTILTGLVLMAIEFMVAGILADRVNDTYFNRDGSLKKRPKVPKAPKVPKIKQPLFKKAQNDDLDIDLDDIKETTAVDNAEVDVIEGEATTEIENEKKSYGVFDEVLNDLDDEIPEVETFTAEEEPELFEMPKAMDLNLVEDMKPAEEKPVEEPEPEEDDFTGYTSASSLITQEEFSALIQPVEETEPAQEDELVWNNLPPAPAELPADYLDEEDLASRNEPGTDPDEMELPDSVPTEENPYTDFELKPQEDLPPSKKNDDPFALAQDIDNLRSEYIPEEPVDEGTVWGNQEEYSTEEVFNQQNFPGNEEENAEPQPFEDFIPEPEIETEIETAETEPFVEEPEIQSEEVSAEEEIEITEEEVPSEEETSVSEEEVADEDRNYGTVTDTGTFNIAADIFSDMDAEVRAENNLEPVAPNPFGEAKDLTADELTAFFNAQQAANTPQTQRIEGNLPTSHRAQKKGPYQIPSDLLTEYVNDQYWIIDDETKAASLRLKETLSEFGIEAEITGIKKGPVITMFELLPASGVKLSKIVGLQDNIALSLAAQSVRIVAPIPGKQAVGIEVPNKDRSIVGFRELIEQPLEEFKKMAVPVILGKDILGKSQIMDLVKTPHLLIAGATGAGKSVCVNSIILSILYKRSPQDVKMILIDPKVVELKLYNNIPHLLTPVITEPKKAFQALQYCLCEMERRYALLDNMGVRDISNYNRKIVEKKICTEKLPYMVVIIDEFADLMATTGKQLESTVARLAAMSRAVGIHLVLATQRPSVNVITGLIKANIPSRIAFMVASRTDSSIIIDSPGAEKLLGRGDMLYASAVDPYPVRIQGTFVSDQEVENVVEYVKQYGEPDYIDDQIFIDDEDEGQGELFDENDDLGEDPLWDQALEVVVQSGKASASYIQRRLKIGYNRAARLVEEMEERGIVGPANGSKPREIIHIP